MDINNLKESRLVSAAEAARWPTRWWLAYIIILPVQGGGYYGGVYYADRSGTCG